MTTTVKIETVAAPVLFIPGPNANKAGCILDRIRDLASDGRRFMRYADDADIDPVALEVIEEALHRATRPMRRGLEAHNDELHARQFAADISANTEEPDDETSPEPES